MWFSYDGRDDSFVREEEDRYRVEGTYGSSSEFRSGMDRSGGNWREKRFGGPSVMELGATQEERDSKETDHRTPRTPTRS